jgi:hypothetical protein
MHTAQSVYESGGDLAVEGKATTSYPTVMFLVSDQRAYPNARTGRWERMSRGRLPHKVPHHPPVRVRVCAAMLHVR